MYEGGSFMAAYEKELSLQAKSLWGKLSSDGTHRWLPLWMHLEDTAEIAVMLWRNWLPKHTKKIIAEGIIDGRKALLHDRIL